MNAHNPLGGRRIMNFRPAWTTHYERWREKYQAIWCVVNPTRETESGLQATERTPDRLIADTSPGKLHLAMMASRHRDQDKPHPEHQPCVIANVCLKTKPNNNNNKKQVFRPFPILEVKKRLCYSRDALWWEGVLLILVQETPWFLLIHHLQSVSLFV